MGDVSTMSLTLHLSPSIMEFAIVYIFECRRELIRKYSQAGGNGKDNSVIVKRDILQRESGLEGV